MTASVPLRANTVASLWIALSLPATHPMLAAQDSSNRPTPPTFELVTVSAGGGLLSWVGHTALLVSQPTGSAPLIFDYGVVDGHLVTVGDELTGRVSVYTLARDANEKMAAWRRAGRSIRTQPLNLTLAERQALFDRLVYDQSPARRVYQYDLLANNCTTRIRDLLDEVTHGALATQSATMPVGGTLREIAYRSDIPTWLVAIVDLLVNGSIDSPATAFEAARFPERLATLVAMTVRRDSSGNPFPLSARRASAAITAPPGATSSVVAFLLAGALIGLVVGAATALRRRGVLGVAKMLPLVTVGCVMGGIGLLLSWLWIGTPYSFAVWNTNILFFSPLLILVPPLAILAQDGAGRASRWLVIVLQCSAISALAGLLFRLLPGAQHSDRMAALACPLLVGALAGALRLRSATVVPARGRSIVPHPASVETFHQSESMI